MVHMRTVNSVATPDRGSGMAHQLASVQRSMGSVPSVSRARHQNYSPNARRLTFAAVAFFLTGFAASTSYAQSSGRSPAWPATGPAAAPSRWTTAPASGSDAAPPTRSAGAKHEHEPDLRQRRLQVQSARPVSSPRAARCPAPGAKPAATSAATSQGRGGGGNFQVVGQSPPDSPPASR